MNIAISIGIVIGILLFFGWLHDRRAHKNIMKEIYGDQKRQQEYKRIRDASPESDDS